MPDNLDPQRQARAPSPAVPVASLVDVVSSPTEFRETTWVIRGLPQDFSCVVTNFACVREIVAPHLPYPRSWFVDRIEEHFKSGGGPLRLVPPTVEEAEEFLRRDLSFAPSVWLVIERHGSGRSGVGTVVSP